MLWCVLASKTVKPSIFVYQNFCCRKLWRGWKNPSLSRTKWPGFPISQLKVTDSTLQKKRSMFWVQEFPRFFVPKHVSSWFGPRRGHGEDPTGQVPTIGGHQKGWGMFHSLKRAASLPLKIGLNTTKGNEKVFQPSIFRDVPVSFREGYLEDQLMTCKSPKDRVKWLG